MGGAFITPSGAIGALSVVNFGRTTTSFGGAGILIAFGGGAGILDLYNFIIANAKWFFISGTELGGGIIIEFLLIIAGSRAGTLATFLGANGAPYLVRLTYT